MVKVQGMCHRCRRLAPVVPTKSKSPAYSENWHNRVVMGYCQPCLMQGRKVSWWWKKNRKNV